jgi:hypothetical protein
MRIIGRRWRVQKFKPFGTLRTGAFKGMGVAVEEQPPAPRLRLYWTLRHACRERDRLNGGMELMHAKERFRVVRFR